MSHVFPDNLLIRGQSETSTTTTHSPMSHQANPPPSSPHATSDTHPDMDTLDPRCMRVEGLPYKSRSLESLQELTRRWEVNGRQCPHPYCQSKPSANKVLFAHWYSTHMAPGYCRLYPCNLCSAAHAKTDSFKLRQNFQRHLRQSHSVDPDQLDPIANFLETRWEQRVSESCMIIEPNQSLQQISQENRVFVDLEPNQTMPRTNPEKQGSVRIELQVMANQNAKQSQNLPKVTKTSNWADMHFKSLTDQWRRKHYRCPHPDCWQVQNADPIFPFQSFMDHWTGAHNANLSGKNFACEFCPIKVCSPDVLLGHLMDAHEMTNGVAASLVNVVIERDRVAKLVTNAPGSPPISPAESSQSLDLTMDSMNTLETQSENRFSPGIPRKRTIDDTLAEDLSLGLEQIPPKRQEVAGLPWKSFNTEKSVALEKAWLNNSKFCPHPACSSHLTSKKFLFQHWHQTHFLPDCGIPYKCYGRKPESEKHCTEVFDNKWDLIEHARGFHKYTDSTINLLLSKVKAARETGKQQEFISQSPKSSVRDLLLSKTKAARETEMQQEYISHTPKSSVKKPRDARLICNTVQTTEDLTMPQSAPFEPLDLKVPSERPRPARKGRALNAIVEQLHQAKVSPTLTTDNANLVQDNFASYQRNTDLEFVPDQADSSENTLTSVPPGMRIFNTNSKLSSSSKSSPLTQSSSTNRLGVPEGAEALNQSSTVNEGMKLYHRINPNPIVIEPLPEAPELTQRPTDKGIVLLSGDLDSELPKAMWKVILNTWRWTLRCPNPECERRPMQYFSHASILAHWLVVHIKTQQRSRLYACRHGSSLQNSEACHHVFAQPADLYRHGIEKHGYGPTDAAKTVTEADKEWETLEKEQKRTKDIRFSHVV